jgi:hypothetical protein
MGEMRVLLSAQRGEPTALTLPGLNRPQFLIPMLGLSLPTLPTRSLTYALRRCHQPPASARRRRQQQQQRAAAGGQRSVRDARHLLRYGRRGIITITAHSAACEQACACAAWQRRSG